MQMNVTNYSAIVFLVKNEMIPGQLFAPSMMTIRDKTAWKKAVR